MSERVLRLHSDGLLSKYGFNDGDEPDELLDYLDEHHPDYDYVTDTRWKPVLVRLVRERLVPALRETVVLVDVETSHNPIRAESVNGVYVGNLWSAPDHEQEGILTPVEVEVPFEDVLAAMLEANDGR